MERVFLYWIGGCYKHYAVLINITTREWQDACIFYKSCLLAGQATMGTNLPEWVTDLTPVSFPWVTKNPSYYEDLLVAVCAAGSVWGGYNCPPKTEQDALLFQDRDLPDSLVRVMFAFRIMHSVCERRRDERAED